MSGENFSFVIFIIRISRYIKRRFVLLFLSLLIGIILGIVQNFLIKDFSIVSFDLRNNSIPRIEIIKDINSFQYYLKNDSVQEIHKIYNINKEQIKSIKLIDCDTLKQNHTSIKLQCYDKLFAKKFPTIYVNYLQNKTTLNANIEKERKKYEQYLEHINAKIKILDTIQDSLILSDGINTNEYKGQGGTFNEFIYLYDKKIELTSKIETYKNVQLSGFVSIEGGKKSLLIFIIQDSLILLFLGFIVSLILEVKRLIKDYELNN